MTCKPDIMPLNVFWSILSKEAVSERNMKLLLETVVYIAVRVTCIITIETVTYIMHCKNTTCIIITASHLHNYSKKQKKQTLWPLFMDGVQLPHGYSHFEEAVYFLPFSSQPPTYLLQKLSTAYVLQKFLTA